MGFPRYSLWGERRASRCQRGPRGTPSLPHHVPQDTAQPLCYAPCPGEYRPTNTGAPHPRRFQCRDTEPGAVPASPTPLRLHAHDVLYPGDCKQSAMPTVLTQGCGARDTLQHWGAPAQCCAQGTASQYGMPVGCREARASRRKPGAVRQGAGAARRPGRVPSSMRSRRPRRHVPSARAHAAGRGETCRGTSRVCVCSTSVQPSEGRWHSPWHGA